MRPYLQNLLNYLNANHVGNNWLTKPCGYIRWTLRENGNAWIEVKHYVVGNHRHEAYVHIATRKFQSNGINNLHLEIFDNHQPQIPDYEVAANWYRLGYYIDESQEQFPLISQMILSLSIKYHQKFG